MPQIECDTLFNKKKIVQAEDLVFRPSVYGLAKHGEKVLLIRTSETGKYEFPGGGIELGERMEESLVREFQEEAGIEVEVGAFIAFKQKFFYHDPSESALHTLLFFYECTALSLDLPPAHLDVDGKVTEEPVWAEISSLSEEDFAGTDKEFFVEFKQKHIL